MKILFLLPSVPNPPDAGARLRNQGLLRLARAEHRVFALAFGTPAEQGRLAGLVDAGEVVPPPPRRGLARRALGMAGSRLPDVAERLWSDAFARRLREVLSRERIDVVQAEGIEMARYLDVLPRGGARRVYDAHNAEFLLQRRAAAAAPSAAAAAYSRLQWRRLERFERHIVRGSDRTLAVSEHDANQLEALALAPPGVVHVVPSGIDLTRFAFCPPSAEARPDLLFVGKLDYRPNAEALAWLLDAVLPRLHAVLPEARLFVVGAGAPRWLVRRGQRDARIAVVGHVADERPYLARCAALVLPLQVAGGSRLKALVAMASGLPIVSTRVGMEGIDAAAGEAYLQADPPAAWLAALTRVLTDAPLRQTLAHTARAIVETHYTWPAIAPRLHAAYAGLA